MKKRYLLILVMVLFSCKTEENKIEVDESKHIGLIELKTDHPFKTLYSEGEIDYAKTQTELVAEAYLFLSEIMGPKKDFCLLTISGKDWKKNAYMPVSGMPEYYKGNLIVGAGQNDMASGYGEMLKGLPPEMTKNLMETYTNASGELDMRLFFDKLAIHELTHSFQDPKNLEGYSMSRWLEEIHANMGQYAFYKSKRPNELKYILHLVDFSLENPPPNLPHSSLSEFDTHYYDLDPANYGFYQMRFTKAAQTVIDSLGNTVLKPLNDFLVKYDESWKEKMSDEDFRKKLAQEVDPYFLEVMDSW